MLLVTLPFSLLLAYGVAEVLTLLPASIGLKPKRRSRRGPVISAAVVVMFTEPLLLYVGLGLLTRLGLR